ncbi:hypothetical protein DFP72DRAFT_815187, partial [Ephemerocybe angulata]
LNHLHLRASVGAAAVGGTVHVAVLPKSAGPEEDIIVGAAIWFAPGQCLNSTYQQREAGWNQFMDAGSDGMRRWWTEYFSPLVEKHVSDPDVFGGERYPDQVWDLNLLAVHPQFHQRGIAKSLLQYAELQAARIGRPLVLKTSTEVDVTIYRRLGFEVKRKIEVESPIGNADLYFMVKETV